MLMMLMTSFPERILQKNKLGRKTTLNITSLGRLLEKTKLMRNNFSHMSGGVYYLRDLGRVKEYK